MNLFFIVVASFTILSGCSDVYHTHGQIIPTENIAMLQTGRHDKLDVQRFLGSPSSISSFNDQQWLYITTKTVDKPLSPSNMLERNVLIINFDENDKLASIDKKNYQDGREITPIEQETHTQGQSMGVVDQMIDNLGRGFGQ